MKKLGRQFALVTHHPHGAPLPIVRNVAWTRRHYFPVFSQDFYRIPYQIRSIAARTVSTTPEIDHRISARWPVSFLRLQSNPCSHAGTGGSLVIGAVGGRGNATGNVDIIGGFDRLPVWAPTKAEKLSINAKAAVSAKRFIVVTPVAERPGRLIRLSQPFSQEHIGLTRQRALLPREQPEPVPTFNPNRGDVLGGAGTGAQELPIDRVDRDTPGFGFNAVSDLEQLLDRCVDVTNGCASLNFMSANRSAARDPRRYS